MNSNPENLIDALIVTAEATGTDLSKAALAIMVKDLTEYETEDVLMALTRCRRELHGRLSLAAIIDRIADGFPGAEEAWALAPKDEQKSAVLCEEILYAIPIDLLELDHIAARMAFLEAYRRNVAEARAIGQRPIWTPSWGHDPHDRERALREAVDKDRIGPARALSMLPTMSDGLRAICEERVALLKQRSQPLLPRPESAS